MGETLNISADQAQQIFGTTAITDPEAFHGDQFMTAAGVSLQFGDQRLGLFNDFDALGERFTVPGNTVPRLCGALGACAASECGLGSRPMALWERQAEDCAAANTVEAFDGRPGFVITPAGEGINRAVFLWDEGSSQAVTALDENGHEQIMFRKAAPGSVLVFSEHDVEQNAEEGVFVAANNADNSLGTATLELDGVRYAMVFSSSRLNLGDRDSDARLLQKGLDGILDRHNLAGEERQRAVENLHIQIDIGYSAGLKNFKHDVRLPEEGSAYANELIEANGLASYSELTPTIVMSGKAGQYPGALEHGEVYGAFEAENDIDVPRGVGGCPGFGEYCYIHYPKITERTLVSQLVEMGLQPEKVSYDASRVIDPASVENRLASNRRMQLAGVPLSKTLRSVNGVAVAFPQRAAA